MAKPLDETELRTLEAYLSVVREQAKRYLLEGHPVLRPGDLEGDLIHAGAFLATSFVHRFKSRLELKWLEEAEEQSRITSLNDLPETGDDSAQAGQGSASTSESAASQSRQRTRARSLRRLLRLLRGQ